MPSKKTSHTIDEIYKKISHLCAKKELSEYDALQYLKKFKISPQETLSILQKLKADNFIDNRRFVRAYIHDKLKFNHWGKHKILSRLQQKKIPGNLSEKIWNETVNENEYLNIMKTEILKKSGHRKNLNPSQRQALFRYMVGKGFEQEKIINLMQQMFNVE